MPDLPACRSIASRKPKRSGAEGASLEEKSLEAAVDDERLAADVARTFGGQEAHDVAELARLAPAAERDLAQALLGRPVGIEVGEPTGLDADRRDADDGGSRCPAPA